jgi:hypothetical protein
MIHLEEAYVISGSPHVSGKAFVDQRILWSSFQSTNNVHQSILS